MEMETDGAGRRDDGERGGGSSEQKEVKEQQVREGGREPLGAKGRLKKAVIGEKDRDGAWRRGTERENEGVIDRWRFSGASAASERR
ncbi:hypothetical protein PBY51_020028 [Eleginops maclovinus]|uniref:Uncharacterized protein n=1 Tax=Eleginops maclovinus TaxID=56733 RepID=A0AAN7XKX3_ELEMC|nr:hypothetical protein PBY51_020028 [Eleginops maclovinus]